MLAMGIEGPRPALLSIKPCLSDHGDRRGYPQPAQTWLQGDESVSVGYVPVIV